MISSINVVNVKCFKFNVRVKHNKNVAAIAGGPFIVKSSAKSLLLMMLPGNNIALIKLVVCKFDTRNRRQAS